MCSTVAFLPLEHSNHVVSVSNDFLSNSKRDALLHRIGLPSYSKFDWTLYLFLLLKLYPKKWSLVLFYEVFFLWSLLFISLNLQYDLAWNTVVVSIATTTSSYLDMLDKVQKM